MRRHLRRTATAVALLALAAGTSGDVGSLVRRVDGDPALATLGDDTSSTAAAASAIAATGPSPTSTTVPRPPEWTLLAGGDVLMDRSEPAGRDPFATLVPALADADIAVVNVEMAVAAGGEPEPRKEFTFRAPPSAAATMATAGVDVGNLGNNHALDFGRDALLETIANLRNAGVTPVGAGADAGEAYAPAVFEIGDAGDERVSVAVLGASRVLPAGWPVGSSPGVATARGEALVEAVRAAALAHDVVVVTVHWGVELDPCPNETEVALADELVGAGATVVLGHHPHVLQPVVERGGGLVAYSLGNLVWHPRSGAAGETGLLEVRFVGSRLAGFTFHPHQLDADGDPAPADAETSVRIEQAVQEPCEAQDPPATTTTAEPDPTVLEPPPE